MESEDEEVHPRLYGTRYGNHDAPVARMDAPQEDWTRVMATTVATPSGPRTIDFPFIGMDALRAMQLCAPHWFVECKNEEGICEQMRLGQLDLRRDVIAELNGCYRKTVLAPPMNADREQLQSLGALADRLPANNWEQSLSPRGWDSEGGDPFL